MPIIVQLIAAVYFSTFIFIILPLLGLVSGTLAGWIMRGVSTGLGAVVGLVTGVLVIVAFLLCGWATSGLLFKADIPAFVEWIIAFSPPLFALALPPIALRIIRSRLKGGGE